MKFIDSYADSADGRSCVIVEHKNKRYKGIAKCHPEDTFSEYTGCRYAEERAQIKALKEEWKEKKAKCEECRKFVKAITQYKNFDSTSDTAKAMYRQLNRRIKEVNDLADKITRKEINLKLSMRQKDKIDKKTN